MLTLRVAIRAAVWLVLFPMVLVGCRQSGGGTGGNFAAATGELKTFPIKGKIVSVNAGNGSVLLNHEAVPGFMDAMTMTYKLKQPDIASELHPGDRITAKLLVTKTSDGFENPMLDEIVVTAQEKPDYKPAVQYHVPEQGDVVPDFKLVNEAGKTIHRAGAAADVHLHALPAGRLLPADEQELCHDRRCFEERSVRVCEDASAEHQL
jgi:protein SCO1/2